MTQSPLPKVNLNRWRPHVLAALEAGQSWAVYARAHGVAKHTLYVAYRHLLARGEVAAKTTKQAARTINKSARQPTAFVPVAIDHMASAGVRIRLPNGVVIEADWHAETFAAIWSTLAALPCSV